VQRLEQRLANLEHTIVAQGEGRKVEAASIDNQAFTQISARPKRSGEVPTKEHQGGFGRCEPIRRIHKNGTHPGFVITKREDSIQSSRGSGIRVGDPHPATAQTCGFCFRSNTSGGPQALKNLTTGV